MRRLIWKSVSLMVCLLWPLGCGETFRTFWSSEQTPPQADINPLGTPGVPFVADAAEPRPANGLVVVRLRFSVMRIELPLGTVQHSLKIWNHIDENIGDPGLTALLARNGFRVGVADRDAWPALEAIFEETGARSMRREHVAEDGLPLAIDLGEVSDGDTYFVHSRGGKLTGGSLRHGTTRLNIDYAMTEEDLGRVELRFTPVIKESRGTIKYVDRGGEVLSIRDYDGQVFDELAATIVIEPGQFLVIGPSRAGADGYLLGSRFLRSTLEMQQWETVLCITPIPVRVR